MKKFKAAQKNQKSVFARLRKNTDGNISLMSAVTVSALLLGVTVTIDLKSTFTFKAEMQEALDRAVLAAATNADDDFWAIGQTAYELNISEDNLAASTVNFAKQNTNDVNEVVGTASGSLPLLFSGVFKKPSMDITVRSVANVASPSPDCIIGDTGITLNGPECETLVPSKSANVLNVKSGRAFD